MGSWTDEQLLQMVHDQRTIVDYFYVSSAALFLYDHFLTLQLEISLVWYQKRWTYTKVIFLMARYLPYPVVFLLLYNQVYPDVPLAACSVTYQVASWLSVPAISSAEGIFMIRTWALWNRNRRIGLLFIGMILAAFVVETVSATKFVGAVTVIPPPYKGSRGCFTTGMSTMAYIALYCLSALDAVILVPMVIIAHKTRPSQTPETIGNGRNISSIIHQDGILSYLYILCLTLTSATFIRFAPVTRVNTVYLLPIVMYSIISTRVVLNIRSMATWENGPSVATELHTNHFHQSTHIPLAFRGGDASDHSISDSDQRQE